MDFPPPGRAPKMWGWAPPSSCTPGTLLYPEGGHKPPGHPRDPTVPWGGGDGTRATCPPQDLTAPPRGFGAPVPQRAGPQPR